MTNAPLSIIDCGVKYFHPIVILIAIFVGSWVPGLTRLINTVIRSLASFLCRL